ncbi:MAG: mechanosensitive ion channel protein MscS [Acidobacteria bacterium]|nr:MAG: mechanosensitive ion channel protein MscS [Acidobacteriota bacterium]
MYLFQQSADNAPTNFDPETLWNSLYGLLNSFLYRVPYLLIALIVFAMFLGIAKLVSRAILTAGQRTRLDVTLAEMLGRLASFVIAILGAFVAAVIIFPAFKPGDLVAGLGITSVAVGFAFKDVLQNFFAGILILWRKPFLVGDELKFKEYEGTVEEITVRSTRLRTFDGERAVIPNGDIYANAVLVKTAFDSRRVKFIVGIGYPDDIEKGRQTIGRVLESIRGVQTDPGPWIYVSELAPSSVNFTVYFWVQSEQANVLRVSDQVATGIKYALDKARIEMPYPHNVVILQNAETDVSTASMTDRKEGKRFLPHVAPPSQRRA